MEKKINLISQILCSSKEHIHTKLSSRHDSTTFLNNNFDLYVEERELKSEKSLRDLAEWNVDAHRIASLTATL